MQAVVAPYPSWGIDCVSKLGVATAAGVRASGASFVMRYLGSLDPDELAIILAAGLLCGVVTYADQWDPEAVVAALEGLSVPAGVCVGIDVESVAESAAIVAERIDACANAVAGSSRIPGLYVGSNQPLDGPGLYARTTVRYWRSMSFVPEPRCGYCLEQAPTTTIAGLRCDVNYVRPDYEGRMWTLIGP